VRVGEHISETCRPSVADKSEPLVSVPAQSPLGDGRGDEHRGDGRGCEPHGRALGKDAPTKLFKTAERRSWRAGCRPVGAPIAAPRAVARPAGTPELSG